MEAGALFRQGNGLSSLASKSNCWLQLGFLERKRNNCTTK